MRVRLRQFLVDVVVKLWPVMPLQIKLWAFMNDGPQKGD